MSDEVGKIDPKRRNFKPLWLSCRWIILLLLNGLITPVFAQYPVKDTASLDKYSYLIYGKTPSGFVQATGFLVKSKSRVYVVTAAHVINGWYYESFEKEGSYPDTLFLRAYTRPNDSLVFIPIDIRKIKNEKSDLGWTDIYFYPVTLPANVKVYSLESLIAGSGKNVRYPDKILCFGFHSPDNGDTSNLVNDMRPLKSTATIAKAAFSHDPFIYQVSYRNNALGTGSSGSPVYFIHHKMIRGRRRASIGFGGMIFGGSSPLHKASVIKPEVIKALLRTLE